jgi:23S rRNA (pseudouridine1915-N3)-methyltransferase
MQGKLKEKYCKLGVEEYLKRMQKYAKVQIQESSSLENLKGFIIALDEKGKTFTSVNFASTLQKLHLEHKNITFVIGEATGLPKEVLNRSNLTLSLSEMTFPNQLAVVVFIEQLYRAFTIIKKEKYHKK